MKQKKIRMIQQWNKKRRNQINDQNKGEFDKIRKECNIRNNTVESR